MIKGHHLLKVVAIFMWLTENRFIEMKNNFIQDYEHFYKDRIVLHVRSCQLHLPRRYIGMKNKDKTISLRLSNKEYTILESNSNKLNMSNSNYLRSLINNALPAEVDYRQNIAPIMSKIQIRLAELGMEDEEITKEVNQLCRML